MAKTLKKKSRFPWRLSCLGVILLLALLAFYALKSGHGINLPSPLPPPATHTPSPKPQARMVSLCWRKGKFIFAGRAYSHYAQIKQAIDRLLAREPSHQIVVVIRRKWSDPVLPVKEIEKFFDDYGIRYIVRKPED